MARRLVWTSAARSHVGTVRSINEDAFLEMPRLGLGGLWAVADGMGGHEAGDVASQTIIDMLRQVPPPSNPATFINTVELALQRANYLLQEKSAADYQRRIIGSTVAVLIVFGNQACCLWVGDSRAYRLRNGQLQQLTRDHSHVQELLDRGLITSTEALRHPMANVITRAVGSSDTLRIDKKSFTLEPGDVFLLCSDGLNKALADEEIAQLLAAANHYSVVQALIHTALIRGANDNVTSAVIRIIREEPDLEATAKTVPLQKPRFWRR
ncbi:MAG: protein phosphatase 2C domain-containing protein [Gammaproteobacteria bacterium]